MIFSTYVLVLSAFFLAFLLISAIFDAHGASVPDVVTLPVAILGICISFFCNRHGASSVSSLILLVYLFLPFPALFSKWSNQIMQRSYGNDYLLQQESDLMDLQAMHFEEEWGETLFSLVEVIYSLLTVILLLFYIENMTLQYLLPLILWVLLIAYLRYSYSHDNSGVEPLSALGGADIIVGIGYFALFGPIRFLYSLILTLSAFIIHYYGKRKVKPNCRQIGEPLLPIVVLMVPIQTVILISNSYF